VYSFVATNLPAGSYQLVVLHPTVTAPFSTPSAQCIPFIFTYSFGSQVSFSNIDPPGSDNLSPSDGFRIVITFSATPFNVNGTLISSANSALVQQAFYLAGSNGITLHPAVVTATNPNARQWYLDFPALGTSGVTFTLSIQTNVLFDGLNGSLQIPGTYKYKTISCGPHGKLGDSGRCECETGYFGTSCEVCDTNNGYITPDGNPSICVKDACAKDTCGCLTASCTTPLGQCSTNASGLAHCECGGTYKGERCEACRDGYYNYPQCTQGQSCNPACKHGDCDPAKGQCKCEQNWAGDACDTCAAGYKGDNCEDSTTPGTDWTATETFLKVAAILIAIALVAGGAFWFWRRRLAGTRYKLVSHFAMDDDDEDGGHRFPDQDNRLVDEEDLQPNLNREESHEEPARASSSPIIEARVDLPGPAGSVNAEAFSNNPARLIDM